jgi:hypothetical protein
MLFLEGQWPESLPFYLDFKESQQVIAINTTSKIVSAEPKRISLGVSNNTTSTTGISTNPNIAIGGGWQLTGSQQGIWLAGPGLELAAQQAWFCHAGATQVTLTVYEITVNRPSSRPILPGQLLPRYEEKPKTVDIFSDMLKKQRRWRKKIYKMLSGGFFNGPRSHPAGAGLADALGSRLRYLQGNHSALSAEE